MTMGTKKVIFLIFLVSLLFIAPEPVLNLDSASFKDGLIEVCSNGIVYVPKDTQYVQCNGKVMKVLRFEPYEGGKSSCQCPNCCDGECFILVICDLDPTNNQKMNADCGCGQKYICKMWVAC